MILSTVVLSYLVAVVLSALFEIPSANIELLFLDSRRETNPQKTSNAAKSTLKTDAAIQTVNTDQHISDFTPQFSAELKDGKKKSTKLTAIPILIRIKTHDIEYQ